MESSTESVGTGLRRILSLSLLLKDVTGLGYLLVFKGVVRVDCEAPEKCQVALEKKAKKAEELKERTDINQKGTILVKHWLEQDSPQNKSNAQTQLQCFPSISGCS